MNIHTLKKYELQSKLSSNKSLLVTVGNESFFLYKNGTPKVSERKKEIKDSFLCINGKSIY